MSTRVDRQWALARELGMSLNTIGVMAYYGLVLDNGKRCYFRDGMSYWEALKQLRLLRQLHEPLHRQDRNSDGLAMRPVGATAIKQMLEEQGRLAESPHGEEPIFG